MRNSHVVVERELLGGVRVRVGIAEFECLSRDDVVEGDREGGVVDEAELTIEILPDELIEDLLVGSAGLRRVGSWREGIRQVER